MSKVQVLIDVWDKNEGRAGIKVLVDGVRISSGSIGGEPEDNSIFRDYGWVVPTIEKLSVVLGAEYEELEVQQVKEVNHE